MTSQEHDLAITEKAEQLRTDGWRAFVLGRKAPDGIAVKGTNVVAIEILGKPNEKIEAAKRHDYSMFDNVFFGYHNHYKPRKVDLELRVPLEGEDETRFERIKKATGIQSNTDVIRFVLKRFDEMGQKK